jgi:DNA-directed RNA polymerase subunit RPC12/RpoP
MKQGTYVCPYCGANILTRELAKTHVKQFHRDKIQELLSKIPKRRLRNLTNKGINPEEWAAGYIVAMFFPEVDSTF